VLIFDRSCCVVWVMVVVLLIVCGCVYDWVCLVKLVKCIFSIMV